VISTSSIPKQTILCIDDEVMLRYEKAQRESLATQFAAQCHGASAQACDYVPVRRVLLDYEMPVMSGYEVAFEIRCLRSEPVRHHGVGQRCNSKEVDHGRRVHTQT
jgi:CheY-like chemotaxis protein